MTELCIICANSFTKKTRSKITCAYCSFDACKECCQTYLLNESTPKCMNSECNREWTRLFLSESFPVSFINGAYKKHREELLFNNERALLPATQPIVERELAKRRIQAEIEVVRNKMIELNRQYSQLYNNLSNLRYTNRVDVERAVFVRACPDSECRGFLSTQWKCGICEKWACSTCHEIKGLVRDVEHTCNPENVATAELLSQDTKPCPQCRARIFKIDGCDQMWCTQCHTAFSWRTGRIENVVHNPHYYEWLRRTNNGNVPRNPNDNPCGGGNRMINHVFTAEVRRIISQKARADNGSFMNTSDRRIFDKKVEYFIEICRSITHIHQVEIPRYDYNYLLNNQAWRVKYMLNEITEEKFKTVVQQNDKKHQKNREIHNLLQMFHDSCTDILFRLREKMESNDWKFEMDILNEINPLIDYVNECFGDISRTYNSVLLQMDYKFNISSV